MDRGQELLTGPNIKPRSSQAVSHGFTKNVLMTPEREPEPSSRLLGWWLWIINAC